MKEIRTIVSAYDRLDRSTTPTARATVVRMGDHRIVRRTGASYIGMLGPKGHAEKVLGNWKRRKANFR